MDYVYTVVLHNRKFKDITIMILVFMILRLIGPTWASFVIEPPQCDALFNETSGTMPCNDMLETHKLSCGTGKPFAGNFNGDSLCDLGCLFMPNVFVPPAMPHEFDIYAGINASGGVDMNAPISSGTYFTGLFADQYTPYALNVNGIGVDEVMLVRQAGSWSNGMNMVLVVDNVNDNLFGFMASALTMTTPELASWCSPPGALMFGDLNCDGKIDYHCLKNDKEYILSKLDTSSMMTYESLDSITCQPYQLSHGTVNYFGNKYLNYWETAVIECNFGYAKSIISRYLTCTKSFEWSAYRAPAEPPPTCLQIPICANISLGNGVVNYYHRYHGNLQSSQNEHFAIVNCDIGFTPTQSEEIWCNLTTLEWTPLPPTCTKPCPVSGEIPNGNYAITTPSLAKITCDPGFIYRGKPLEDVSCNNGQHEWPPLLCTEESYYHAFKVWQKKTVQNKVHFKLESHHGVSSCAKACKATSMCRSTVHKETTSQCFMFDEFVSGDDMIYEDKSSVSIYTYH